MTPKFWDAAKAVLRGQFIALQAYLKNKKNHKQSNITPQRTRKRTNEAQSQLKEGNEIPIQGE